MERSGPTYCETPVVIDGVFPVEFVNTISNFPTILLGLLAFYFVWRFAPRAFELYVLSFLLFATGVGSTIWHGTRNVEYLLPFDVLPGVLFLLLFVFFWSHAIAGRVLGSVVVGLLLGSQYLIFRYLEFGGVLSPFFALYAVVLIAGAALLVLSFKKFGRVGFVALLAVFLALFAASMRTLDSYACEVISFGTHLLWHAGLGNAALMCIWFLIKVRRLQNDERREP